MKTKEAYEALLPTLEDISKIFKDMGLNTQVRCGFSGVDLEEHQEINEAVVLIFGEISFGFEDTGRYAVIDCAVSVTDGEVANDQLLREITDLRAEAKRIAELAAEHPETDIITLLTPEVEEASTEVDYEKLFDKYRPQLKKSRRKRILKRAGIILGAVIVVAAILLIILL